MSGELIQHDIIWKQHLESLQLAGQDRGKAPIWKHLSQKRANSSPQAGSGSCLLFTQPISAPFEEGDIQLEDPWLGHPCQIHASLTLPSLNWLTGKNRSSLHPCIWHPGLLPNLCLQRTSSTVLPPCTTLWNWHVGHGAVIAVP